MLSLSFSLFKVGWVGIKTYAPIYVGYGCNIECQMRISLSDSLLSGFKRWSDAQDAKPELTAVRPVVDGAEWRSPTAAAHEECGDDIG